MEDGDWLKRVIHFICGAAVGALAAVLFIIRWARYDYELPALPILLGAMLVVGLVAAFFLDRFWDWCRDILGEWRWWW